MSHEQFRQLSPEAPELAPIISGLFDEYSARYGDFFARHAEVELTEWYLPPQGLFIVLERDGEIIAMGAYKPYDAVTAELKRIWTRGDLRRQGLAQKVLVELERRALEAGYRQVFLTTGFRQPEAVRLYLSYGYQPQFDITRDPVEYSLPPHDGRLRFRKPLGDNVLTEAVDEAS
ncbi:GNAT family N-acetyltransferase [Erwinia sp. Leaf53]|uniref:GNAT family N-acetyltransferase n=1 Tax=Erwinia sp. Leaf53 TaxID=1736225 RepID=UPI0006FD5B7E|nr:GNAT family N-acetyltransferase [Erwinia sp. Leaf53]KQN55149.1 acetyltransferase [Erwinia sp. Leaf53]